MSTQREIPYTGAVKCVCGKLPKAYMTDGKFYHVECYPCQHITMRLSTQHGSNAEFARMMLVKQADMAKLPQGVSSTLNDMSSGRVLELFHRGSRA